jgi:hypothetical protein
MSDPRPPKRFFVAILAPTQEALRKLGQYDLDVFAATSHANEAGEFVIDGLLKLDDIGRLVEDGYQVLVKYDSNAKARALTEKVEFEDWLKEMR